MSQAKKVKNEIFSRKIIKKSIRIISAWLDYKLEIPRAVKGVLRISITLHVICKRKSDNCLLSILKCLGNEKFSFKQIVSFQRTVEMINTNF